ncbi:hypothetical protein [Glycomyces salinus]|uniref:hypothetical protein n=1 Tax=Glycomyces salinus TaxID=980294 RepID=UPI0018ED9D31|nr:hypothetical protein [Glycomyces salinus]
MSQPPLNQLGFDLETLRVDAIATLQALCEHFQPEHATGLRMLLGAAEYVQRTVIGPPETDPRRMLDAPDDLPAACVDLDAFAEPAELAWILTDRGWSTTTHQLWDEDEANHFVSSARSVLALRLERTMRVTVTYPDPRRMRPRSALIERGEYLACASGERLFFTDALCRLPHGQSATDLDLTAIPGVWIGTLIADCDTCDAAWRVDTSGDFRNCYTPADAPAWNFFDAASDFAYISCTIACPIEPCDGRVAFELP